MSNQDARIASLLEGILIANEKTGLEALKVETQSIENTFTEEYTTNQTEQEIITPEEGNKLVVKDVSMHTKANSGTVSLDFNGTKVSRLYSSVNNRFSPSVSSIVGEVDEPLVLNSTTGDNELFISVNYVEVAGD